ncbi:MAG: sulfur carrier protein ThiS adenylyltransferase ThiF, partial [Desulfobacterales bacterium]|nr:sulfur carrier protein ThiS adenylyltransferase ThiF [Desulfobacterales bacterium]
MKIGIAGIGGIGSNVARILAQAGVNRIKLVDFDRVESVNLDRQFYTQNQVGEKKTGALKENLLQIHPGMRVETVEKRIRPGDSSLLFNDCGIVVEGFDNKQLKKMIVEELSSQKKLLVSASGIAGKDLRSVKTKRMGTCHVVGDFSSDQEAYALFPPKIAMIAAMMSKIVLDRVSDGAGVTKGLPKGIYGILGEKFSNGQTNVQVARQMVDAGVAILQYREKLARKSRRQIYEECLEIRKITADAGVLFIVNDFLDVAVMVNADGIHQGQDDLPVKAVRKMAPDLMIGCSTHSPGQARSAVEDGADYIGVGPIFTTRT